MEDGSTTLSVLAGKPAPKELMIDPKQLERDYYRLSPDPADPRQRVAFGTSGHRGTSSDGSFTEAHILAITQAICEYRKLNGIDGPVFMGKDTHALSGAAQRTALEVLCANEVETFVQAEDRFTPTPVISRAILVHNRKHERARADGIIITPSHNPPVDGGFKYNPPNGGPADTDITGWIQKRANELLESGGSGIKRRPFEAAIKAKTTHQHDYIRPYVEDLGAVIDMECIRSSGVSLGVDPLGGASLDYWDCIKEHFGLKLDVVNRKIDPTFAFMTVDHDGKIRMDCSSPYAMASLVKMSDRFDVAFGNDPDADRHGIVTRGGGLMNPNNYLVVAISYLLKQRSDWKQTSAVGKTLVSSSLIDRVTKALDRKVWEVPVGFKWFTDGLFNGTLCFGGEESAGASFLCKDGAVWTTDKDGIIMGLLAAEITASTKRNPSQHFSQIVETFGRPYYSRVDTPATLEEKKSFAKLTPDSIKTETLAGEPIIAKLVRAPGNEALIGGLKVVAANCWFAARPSGTENIYKLYAESFKSKEHLGELLVEAKSIVTRALNAG